MQALKRGLAEPERMAIAERLLVIEIEARLDELRCMLEIRHAHAEAIRARGNRGAVRHIRLDLLLAAAMATETESLLGWYRSVQPAVQPATWQSVAGQSAAAAVGRLRVLEAQADTLAAAITRCAGSARTPLDSTTRTWPPPC